MLKCGIVPDNFGRSYSVPIPTGNCSRAKSVTVDDFRAISICPVISKIFQLGVFDRFNNCLSSSDNQFGFKKNLSSNHSIYSLRKVVDSDTSSGSTVNFCSLDLSKALDKTKHNALLIKFMNRNIPKFFCLLWKTGSTNH